MSTLNFKKTENKKLVNTLNRKMFRGFLKIKKLKEIKEYKKNNKFTKIISPTNQWKEYVPLPFEDNYNITYESRFLQKLNNNDKIQNPIEIKNIKPNTSHSLEKNINNKIFLTNNINNNNKNILNKTQNFSNSNRNFNNTYSRNQMDLISKIFPEKSELTKFTNLPFFSLTKNPNLHDINNNKNLFKSKTDKEKKLIEEDFIYKLSHKKEIQTDNNFYSDKLKKGNTMNYFPNNKNLNPNNKQFQLNIKNLKTNQFVSQLNPEERHLQRIEKNLLELKTLPGELFNDLTNNLWNDDYDDNLYDKKLNEKLEKGINSEKEEKFINLNDVLDLLNHTKKKYNNNYTNFIDPKIYKYNNYDYISQQLKNKQERFEFIHRLAFEDFKSRRNTKPINLNFTQNMKSYIDPNSHLLAKKKTTNKTLYEKESKIRDMLIGNKLKCEYNKDDIERVLNGISPWKSIKEKYEQ